jgi:hypothetical protein
MYIWKRQYTKKPGVKWCAVSQQLVFVNELNSNISFKLKRKGVSRTVASGLVWI